MVSALRACMISGITPSAGLFRAPLPGQRNLRTITKASISGDL
jgi:hypothetical protein